MREIKTEIEIAASASEVWAILMDFHTWAEWNPIVNQASGTATLGAKLSITMRGPEGKDGQKYFPQITEFSAPSSFRWRAYMMLGFLFTNDKIFELEETTAGIRLTHIEAFSGLLVPLFWGKLKDYVPGSLRSMNEALKKRAELNSQP